MSDCESIRFVTVTSAVFPVSRLVTRIRVSGGNELEAANEPLSNVESPLWSAAFPSQKPAADTSSGTRSRERPIHLFIR